MNVFFYVLTQNILPILIVAGFGFLLRRRLNLDARTLSSVVFTVLAPCLVFSSLANSELPAGELVQLAGFTVIYVAIMGGLAFGLARLMRLGRVETAALLIVTMFANGGNYGLTLLHLRYGEDGLSRGVVYYVTSTVMVYTVGVLVASLGSVSWRETLKRMARLPAVYAALLAVVVYSLHIPIPGPIMSGITIAGNGAIPVMLLILGMQIAELRPGESNRIVLPAVALRLIGGPLVGLGVTALVGLQGLGRSAMIIESAMPTAVICIILAAEFRLPTSGVARIVGLSTLISPLTIAAVITILSL